MTRKGYQVQVERRKKADQLAKEKISAQIKSIRRELRDTEEQKNQLGEQEDVLRMNEESNGYHLLDERIGALETRNQAQIAGMCMTAFLALAGALLLALEAGSTIPAVLVGVAGILAFIAELNFEMRTVRELEKRKRMKSRWIARQNKLEGGRSSLEEELREKNMELSNLTEEDGILIDRKLNVALTRARKQMLLTGVPALLERNPLYKSLLKLIESLRNIA